MCGFVVKQSLWSQTHNNHNNDRVQHTSFLFNGQLLWTQYTAWFKNKQKNKKQQQRFNLGYVLQFLFKAQTKDELWFTHTLYTDTCPKLSER